MKNQLITLTMLALLFSLGTVSAAQCVAYGSVSWGLEDSYGIGLPIVFTPQIISGQDLSGKAVVIRLLLKDQFTGVFSIIDQITGLNILSDNSLPPVNFPFGVSQQGIIKFELEIIEDAIIFESQEVTIQTSMIITISVPPQVQNTGGEISIPISITDTSTPPNIIPSPSVTAEIKKSVTEFIQPTSVTSSQITFITDHIGWVQIKVEADAIGYAHAVAETTFELISANAVPRIQVDGLAYELLDQGKISTGTKEISVGVDVGGVPTQIDKVELYMQRPDGGFDLLTFTPETTAKTKWKTNYNFLSGDRTYTMGGNPNLGVIGTASNFATGNEYPISVFFSTVGEGEEPPGPPTPGGIPFWVWIVGAVVLIVIVVAIIIAVRRK